MTTLFNKIKIKSSSIQAAINENLLFKINNNEEEFLKIEIDVAWNGQEAVDQY